MKGRSSLSPEFIFALLEVPLLNYFFSLSLCFLTKSGSVCLQTSVGVTERPGLFLSQPFSLLLTSIMAAPSTSEGLHLQRRQRGERLSAPTSALTSAPTSLPSPGLSFDNPVLSVTSREASANWSEGEEGTHGAWEEGAGPGPA